MNHNVPDPSQWPVPALTRALAQKLLDRLDKVRLFGHAYPLLTNLTHGRYRPIDLLDFAWRHELDGMCIHVLDGDVNSLARMPDDGLRAVAERAQTLGLALHLELSSTARADVDEAARIAEVMGVHDLRVYSRYEGRLSSVMTKIEADLRYVAQLAERFDLHVDFEQHEELKSAEIAALLRRVNHPRINALFDFGNMINACEQPLSALRNLAPHIRQVHMKGVRVVPEVGGFGHYGVLQGSADDELPGARMLFELLMLGEDAPQVTAFILEQENHYPAPAFRMRDEEVDPFIPYREMSDTPLPAGFTVEQMMDGEERWAIDQIVYVRSVLSELRELAQRVFDTRL
ncbi:sugar phosphate isomerase/epimerase family protein [Burkholderia diffusa]|uniref:sugar phosphate isomerase/epimerase family protein n=1 Tax=Burkholderia diffusa TaxID=488732 RepID=UPI001ABFDE94|nr:TIM barrel protein [Burkholderia diffusa]